jgi:NADH-quinone oxidoreductase subunit N
LLQFYFYQQGCCKFIDVLGLCRKMKITIMAGFFAKWSVFLAAIDAGLYPLAVIGMLTSVVACFYYLRIVKVIYLDEPAATFDPVSREVTGVMVLCGLLVLFYWAYPGPLAVAADNAAKSLF